MVEAALSSYKVAATNENWQPMAGVEIEAMNLSTLLADSVVRTGRDGVATFTGLPAGPHFFRVRAKRKSTAVGQRTFIGEIHLQVIAWAGIVKHAVVDQNGFGTHTTVQAAVDAILAQALAAGGGHYVIHINPGLYEEDVAIVCPAGAEGMGLILEAQGEQTETYSIYVVTIGRRDYNTGAGKVTVTGEMTLGLRQLFIKGGVEGISSALGYPPTIILRQVEFGILGD